MMLAKSWKDYNHKLVSIFNTLMKKLNSIFVLLLHSDFVIVVIIIVVATMNFCFYFLLFVYS